MNLGQIISLVQCAGCNNPIEIYPSQESVKCNICGNNIDLKMRDFTKDEAEKYEEHLLRISKPTGKNFYDSLNEDFTKEESMFSILESRQK